MTAHDQLSHNDASPMSGSGTWSPDVYSQIESYLKQPATAATDSSQKRLEAAGILPPANGLAFADLLGTKTAESAEYFCAADAPDKDAERFRKGFNKCLDVLPDGSLKDLLKELGDQFASGKIDQEKLQDLFKKLKIGKAEEDAIPQLLKGLEKLGLSVGLSKGGLLTMSSVGDKGFGLGIPLYKDGDKPGGVWVVGKPYFYEFAKDAAGKYTHKYDDAVFDKFRKSIFGK